MIATTLIPFWRWIPVIAGAFLGAVIMFAAMTLWWQFAAGPKMFQDGVNKERSAWEMQRARDILERDAIRKEKQEKINEIERKALADNVQNAVRIAALEEMLAKEAADANTNTCNCPAVSRGVSNSLNQIGRPAVVPAQRPGGAASGMP